MRVAIVSDTHGNVANFKKAIEWLNNLPAQVGENVQTILHCGDIGSIESLKESLQNFKGEFFGVFGNMDQDYRILVEEYNEISGVKISEKVFETKIADKNIAVTHKPEDAKVLCQSGKFDVVFYGHTHKPWQERVPSIGRGGCQLINPGELAGQLYKPTFAIYDTETDNLELKILEKL